MKPIIFSTPMVQAILDDRKTQTRRVIKPQPPDKAGKIVMLGVDELSPGFITETTLVAAGSDWGLKAPWQPGDVLWVRETWKCVRYNNMDGDLLFGVTFKADGKTIYVEFDDSGRYEKFGKFAVREGWQPSIFMPEEVARLFLEVRSVRLERLQEISKQGHHDDILKEGYPFCNNPGIPLDDFISLWDGIYGKNYPWESNPWVWVIEFMRKEAKP